MGIASLELLMAMSLKVHYGGDESKQFDVAQYVKGAYLAKNIKTIRGSRPIFLSIIGLCLFWAISQVVLAT